MAQMYSIGKVCEALSGVTSVIFADMTNVGNYGPEFLPPTPSTPPSFTDAEQLYSIAYERYSGEVTRQSVADQGGDSARYQLSLFVPKSRVEVDVLLRRWRNRLLCVVGIDRYGSQHILYNAIASWTHTTGNRPGTRHGYTITFSAPSHYILSPIAGTGDIATAPPLGGGGGVGTGDGERCITINPINIAYTPSPTGNAMNRNELVTTLNGSVYFIDHTGRSIILNRPAPRYYFWNGDGVNVTEIILPLGFPLPNPDDYDLPVYDEQAEMSIRLWVKFGARWLQYSHAEGFSVNHAERKLLIPMGTAGGNVEVYSYENIPARPL